MKDQEIGDVPQGDTLVDCNLLYMSQLRKYLVSSLRAKRSNLKRLLQALRAFAMPLAFLFIATILYADTVSSSDLIERAKELDGKTITYKGEAVTAILNRGEYSWLNLNDGVNAIGVWPQTADLEAVRFIGDYKHKGDVLEVEGVFNRACPMHGGELDIHANVIRVTEKGYALMERMDNVKIILSAILFSAVLAIVIIFRKRI